MVCAENEITDALMHQLSEGLLYLDEHLVVVDKPAGLLAVPGRGEDKQDCVAGRAQAIWPDACVVHRLDMATSGVMLMARGPQMQRALSRAFETREVRKQYVAVVDGCVAGESGEIDLPIGRDWADRPLRKIDPEGGKPSRTAWQVLAREAQCTRVLLEPITGRTHQLRLHLAAVGHAILGDPLYAPQATQPKAHRLLLHAWKLALVHPATGDLMEFESGVPF